MVFLLKILHNLLFLGKCLSGEEDFGNIGDYIDVEGGIKPCDFPFSCFVFIAFLGGSVSNCRFGLYLLFLGLLYMGVLLP